MKTLKLSENDIEYLQLLIENDISEAVSDISFSKELKIDPVDYINQLIHVTSMFDLDFWEVVSRNCSKAEAKRLHDLYKGKPLNLLIKGN